MSILHLRSEWDKGITIAREVLSKYPAMFEAHYLLGLMLFSKGKADKSAQGDELVKKAADAFGQAYKLRPRDPIPYLNRGAALVYLGSKNSDKAMLRYGLKHYTFAVMLAPNDPKIRLLRFKMNYRVADYAACEEDITALKKLLPKQPNIWEAAANLHEAMKKYREAFEDINTALKLAPNVPKYMKFKEDLERKTAAEGRQ